jgi:DGQHR domain-containing protein
MAGLSVNAFRLEQHGYELYLFYMRSDTLANLSYVTPRTKDNPDEVQRILDPKRAKSIGEYIKEDTALLPNAIVVSLSNEVKIVETGAPDAVIVQFPDSAGKFAYVLDGQHRLGGFSYSDGVQFDLPVVALYDANEHLRGKTFADINSKQVKVSDTHLLELYYQIKELPSEESATMDIVHALASDADSPMCGKIKLRDDQKQTWVSNKHMKQCIAPHTESGGVLHSRTPAVQVQILKEYLKGVRDLYPAAWGNNKEYLLTKPLGIEVVMSAFPAIKHRCDLNCGKQYTASNFRKMLEPILAFELEIPGGGKIPMNWESGKIGPLSNAAGRALISKQLKNCITRADE